MVEQLTKLNGVERYWASGGRLDRCGFNNAMSALSQPVGQVSRVQGCITLAHLAQVTNMEKFSKIPITQEQRRLYIVLRESVEEGVPHSSANPPGTAPSSTLTDQRLMAEVLRLTDEESHIKFMDAYPEIFQSS